MYEPISNKVTDQLNARKSIVEKKVGRTDLDLKYLTSNTGWVMLSSGVNTITSEEEDLLLNQEGRTTISGDPSQAKSSILMGGTTNLTGNLKGGIFEPGNNNPAYNFYSKSTGYRPMSGITGLSVESKNTFGTLREAEVKIIAWSLEEFENIEKLYLRPGFTMLLEWGHSFAVDNKTQEIGINSGVFNENFFKNGVKRTALQQYIENNRENYSQNYEAMLGYVKNFSWKYLPSGGYECTVSIISTGEILDSLKFAINPKTRGLILNTNNSGSVSSTPPSKVVTTEPDIREAFSGRSKTQGITFGASFTPESAIEVKKSIGADASKKELKSPYHYFFSRLSSLLGTHIGAFTEADLPGIAEFISRLQPFAGYHIKTDHIEKGSFFDNQQDCFWLPLRVYLDIFNNYITLIDSSKDREEEDYSLVKFNIDYKKSSKIVTTPEQFSIDPTVCLLQTNHNIPDKIPEQFRAFFGKVKGVHDTLITDSKYFTNGYSDVLNILVPTFYVEHILDAALAEDYENSKGATEVFREILSGINTALGGINDLDIHYDEDSSTFFIVDRNNTPQDPPPVEFDLIGLKSIFTEVGIESKLTNRTSTMIAVAAQGASQSYTENIGSLLQWNKGVIDRVHRTRGTVETNVETVDTLSQQKTEEDWTNWYSDVSEFFSDFWDTGWNKGYTDEQKENAKTLHSEYIKYFIDYNNVTAGKPSQSPIPVELSLKLEGISGLKIGNTFKIKDGILPSQYAGRFGYIITGLSHTVEQGSKWITSIKAQFFPIEKPKAVKGSLKTLAIVGDLNITVPLTTTQGKLPDYLRNQVIVSQEFWTLVAICATEARPGDGQGRADVAQSIYNRLGSKAYPGNTLTQQILQERQYQPTWRWPKLRIEGKPNEEWRIINNIQSAAKATNLSESIILQAAKDITNPIYQRAAATFVQGRTDFLGSNQPARVMSKNGSKVQRTKYDNQFGFSGKYNKNVAYGVPVTISTYKVPR